MARDFAALNREYECAASLDIPPDRMRMPGRLRFDLADGICFRFVEGTKRLPELFERIGLSPLLVGTLQNGRDFTLLDCHPGPVSGFSVTDRSIQARRLIVGARVSDTKSASVREVQVAMTRLADWLGTPSVTGGAFCPSPHGQQAEIKFATTPNVEVTAATNEPSLTTWQEMNLHLQDHQYSASSMYWWRIRTPDPITLDQAWTRLFQLQLFFTLLYGHQAYYDHVRIICEDDNAKQQPLDVLFRAARPSAASYRAPRDVLLPHAVIGNILPLLWTNWTTRYEQYSMSAEVFSSTEMFEGQLLEFQMLAIMQALETLHRHRLPGLYTSQDEYKCVERMLVDAMPSEISQPLRESLKSRLKYGNEYSLRRRLTELATMLSPETQALLHSNLQQFLSRAIETRNYLTHYPPDLHSASMKGAELFWSIQLLRWFYAAVLLKDLGVDDGTIRAALERSEQRRDASDQVAVREVLK